MFQSIFANVRAKSPLVHNITNYVTVNDCANIVHTTAHNPPYITKWVHLSIMLMPSRSRTSPRCVRG